MRTNTIWVAALALCLFGVSAGGQQAVAESPVVDYDLVGTSAKAGDRTESTAQADTSPKVDYDLVATPGKRRISPGPQLPAGWDGPVVDYDVPTGSPGGVQYANETRPTTGKRQISPGPALPADWAGPVVNYDLDGTEHAKVAARTPAPVSDASSDTRVEIPLDGPTLRPGRRHPHVALIRKRLGVAAPEGGDADYYDNALAESVKQFQRAQGLDVDGLIGSKTRAAFQG